MGTTSGTGKNKDTSAGKTGDDQKDAGGEGETLEEFDPTDMDDVTTKNINAQKAMLASQSTMQLAGMTAQITTAGLNMLGQTVGATTAMAVQTVTDLSKTIKDGVKAQGEAFQRAN